jgi:hypothetical protein
MDNVVIEIGSSFTLNGGRPRLADDALVEHARIVAALEHGRRARVAVELVALACRAADTEQDTWDEALVQLSVLIAVALGDLNAARDTLTASFPEAQARKLVGAIDVLRPVAGDGRPRGASSPINTMLASRITRGEQQ